MADVGYVLLLHLSHLRAEVVDVLHLALAGLERVVFQKKLFELMRCIEIGLLGLLAGGDGVYHQITTSVMIPD